MGWLIVAVCSRYSVLFASLITVLIAAFDTTLTDVKFPVLLEYGRADDNT
jgi:hypothetical protein